MSFKRNKTRKIIAILLALGATMATGFVAFVGALALSPLIPIAIMVAIFAGGVDGIVFWQNIKVSLKRIVTPDFLEDTILANKIQELLDKKAKLLKDGNTSSDIDENVWFLKAYQEQNERKKQLKLLPHSFKRDESLLETKEKLSLLRQYFKSFINRRPIVHAGIEMETFLTDSELNQWITEKDKDAIRLEIHRKILFTRLSWIAILISGVS
ncbi:MAG: hypothetical protein WBE18_05705, partial [Gammaproteobacteria bacterium]